jgi:integrase
VFTKAEASAVIAQMEGARRLVAGLLYGSGLRIMEAVRLRVKDLDFSRDEIVVRDGKGEKDRVTVLPQAVKHRLSLQIAAVEKLHKEDLKHGFGDVYLPYALDRKYKYAGIEFVWQYVFPAAKLSIHPRSGKMRRHHVNEQNVQRAVKEAISHSGGSEEWQLSFLSA